LSLEQVANQKTSFVESGIIFKSFIEPLCDKNAQLI